MAGGAVSVNVIIPYAGHDPDRARAVAWVMDHIDYPQTVALGSLPFNKALTVMPEVERSRADIVVMHDADVWTPELDAAIEAVEQGAAWAIPHWKVYRLTPLATDAVLTTPGEAWSMMTSQDVLDCIGDPVLLARRPYVGMAGGGIVVVRRDAMLDIPLDPRFTSWGQEDESWAMALWCLLGPPWRGEAPLVHLWHALEAREGQRKGSQSGWDLRNRYARVRLDLPGMRELLAEAKDALFVSG